MVLGLGGRSGVVLERKENLKDSINRVRVRTSESSRKKMQAKQVQILFVEGRTREKTTDNILVITYLGDFFFFFLAFLLVHINVNLKIKENWDFL